MCLFSLDTVRGPTFYLKLYLVRGFLVDGDSEIRCKLDRAIIVGTLIVLIVLFH